MIAASLIIHLVLLLTLLGRPGRPAGTDPSQGLIAVTFISGMVAEAKAELQPTPEQALEDLNLTEPEEELPDEIPLVEEQPEQDQPELTDIQATDQRSIEDAGDRSLLEGTPGGVIEAPFDNPLNLPLPWGQDADINKRCGDETDPECATCPPPEYPVQALRRSIEGQVWLDVEVLTDGRVGDLYVEKSSDFPMLDNAALEGVKQWQFYPGSSCGEPVVVHVKVPIAFQVE